MNKQVHKNVESIYPLSPMQQGMLFHTLYAPESGNYFQQISCTLSGDFNPDIFQQAWQRVVDRHSILRTLFLWEGRKQPLQVVRKSISLPWIIQDWRSQSPGEQQTQLEQFLQTDRKQGFQLNRAPLVRFALIQIAETAYYFVWSYHHLLMDAWCKPLILNEVLTLYRAFSQGKDLKLPPPLPYRDYIAWLQKQDFAQAEAFWRQSLQGFTQPTQLPIGNTLDNSLTDRGEQGGQQIQFSVLLSEALRTFAQQHRLTLNTLVQGGWALLLSCYSGETDVLFGATVSGRSPNLIGSESIVGMLINTLPVRVQVSEEADLLPWLQEIQSQQIEREQYAYTPLVDIQKWSETPRGRPLFESFLVFENNPVDQSLQQRNYNINISYLSGFERTNYPLNVVVAPEQQLRVHIYYDSKQFKGETIERMLRHLENLLAAIVDNPQQRLSEISLLSAAERHQFIVEWNNTQAKYPNSKCIHQLFEEQVERTPDAIAAVFEEKQLSYQELNAQANQVAHYLQGLGVRPEVLVGLCVERSLEMIVGLLGILKVGGAYVPLDPSYPQERLQFMLADAQAPVLLTQERLLEALPESEVQVVCLDRDWPEIAQAPAENFQSGVTAENLAYVIYTSGSTGNPKGVMIEHQSLSNFITGAISEYEITQRDRVLQFASISFDVAAEEIYPCLTSGGTLVLRTDEMLSSVSSFLRGCWDWNLTVLDLPTAYWSQLITEFETTDLGFPDSLRLVIIGGEQAPPEQVSLWQKMVKNYPRLVNAYGPTEATVDATLFKLPETSSAETGSKKLPIGHGFPHVQTYILDQHQQLVPVGIPGELHIGGAGLARGYLNRPELTAEKFIANPFGEGRLYKTGDLARYLPDSNIEFLGRIDHQVKIRGFRIELGEIESVLSRHEQVQQCVVIAREDAPGDKRLAAYVVSDNGMDVSALKGHLKRHLPDYMTPAAFVRLDQLPLTPNDKVDRRALPAPDPSQQSLETGCVAPRTLTEELVAGIWTDLLGCEVGVHDNFFELGGHSLLATQLISRLRQTFSIELPLRSLFERSTVAQLSELIDICRQAETGLQFQAIEPTPRDGDLPLSFAQQRLWFLDQLEESSAIYNMPTALRLKGSLNLSALQQAIATIVARHESLRTTFPSVNGQPLQTIAPSLRVDLPIVDLQTAPEDEQSVEVQRLIVEEAQRPFDLAVGPLLRVSLLQLSENAYVLLATMHHIVSDGWSMGVLIQEIVTLYEAFSKGEPSPLTDLAIQYADFARWQRQWLQGEVLETQLNYWKQQLAGAPPLLELPTDRPRPPVQTFSGAVERFELDADLTAQLKQLCQRTGTTLFMTLLAAFVVLLYRYSGQEDIVVGSPIANRNRPEIEPLIGFFLNTLALRTRLQDNPTFVDLLSQVRQIALDAYAHQDLPFEKLVEELQPQRSLSYSPLFQVTFVFQNTPGETLELPGLSVTRISERESVAAKFDLTLFISESDSGLTGMWRYNTDLFDAATIDRMSGHFQTLLTALVANPQQPVGQIPLLQVDERHRVLTEWNRTQTEFPPVASLQHLFEAQAEQTQEAAAVVFEGQQLSYGELNRRANQLAHHLQSLGVGPESRVGLYVERSLEMLVGLWGILKAGGAYVPLDPTHPQQRVAFLLEDAQVSVLLTQQRLMERLPESRVATVCLDADWPLMAQQRQDNPNGAVSLNNLAYVIYTSGSTGQPKGVAIEHRSIVNYVQGVLQRISPVAGQHWAMVSTIAADLGNTVLYPALCTGGCLHVLSREQVTDPDAFADYCEQRPIDILKITPSHLAALQSSRRPAEVMPQRQLILGGEAASCEWVAELQALAPECKILNHYGPTETTVGVLTYPVQEQLPASGVAPLGRPLANTEVYILDRYLQPVPVGAPGELYIGGMSLARGYLNRPELTAAQFIPHPFKDEVGPRLYKTGDLARRRADGDIEFLGRVDHQVKIRGFRIELGEVEAVLGQHPQVQQGVVIAAEDGVGDQRLAAYAAVADASVTPSELRRFLRERLPEYMTPSTFVLLDALPLTSNGKVDRQALPAPNIDEKGLEVEFVASRNETEILLANILTDVLGLHRVGIHDNFFDLGGHSLHATQAISRIRAAFTVELPLRSLFEHPTIAELADVLVSMQLEQADNALLEQILAEVDAMPDPEVQ